MSRHPFPLSLVLALSLVGCSATPVQPKEVSTRCHHRNESIELEIGYCSEVRVGRTLYVSGVAGQGDMQEAIKSVYDRLGMILTANGASFANVVKENVYSTDLDAFIRNKALRKAFYRETLPAATWVQVQRLYVPTLVLEIEIIAELPE